MCQIFNRKANQIYLKTEVSVLVYLCFPKVELIGFDIFHSLCFLRNTDDCGRGLPFLPCSVYFTHVAQVTSQDNRGNCSCLCSRCTSADEKLCRIAQYALPSQAPFTLSTENQAFEC